MEFMTLDLQKKRKTEKQRWEKRVFKVSKWTWSKVLPPTDEPSFPQHHCFWFVYSNTLETLTNITIRFYSSSPCSFTLIRSLEKGPDYSSFPALNQLRYKEKVRGQEWIRVKVIEWNKVSELWSVSLLGYYPLVPFFDYPKSGQHGKSLLFLLQ